MKKRRLEMILSGLQDIKNPDPSLEQYSTPPEIVSEILFLALEMKDIENRSIIELGCGGAPFMIGALLLGAKSAIGYDIDRRAVKLAKINITSVFEDKGIDLDDIDYEINNMDVSDKTLFIGNCDTVFMNPPFGSQKKNADRPFLERASSISNTFYSIHMTNTIPFVEKLINAIGWHITHRETYIMPIPHRFDFHRRERHEIPVTAIRAVQRQESLPLDR